MYTKTNQLIVAYVEALHRELLDSRANQVYSAKGYGGSCACSAISSAVSLVGGGIASDAGAV